MLLKKQGLPAEDELLICTVTKLHFHSIFVNIDEYGNSGMIHISEIAPGRIRNIRDFVEEGKIIVCKVLRVDREKGHIDLSLRRVNESQRRQKLDEVKKEQKVEKIIEQVAKQLKLNVEVLFKEISAKVSDRYTTIHDAFEDVIKGNVTFLELGIDDKYLKELDETVKTRIKPEEVVIKGKFILKSYEPDGVEMVKDAIIKAKENGNKNTTLLYAGAGIFNTTIKAEQYKEAETVLKNMTEAVAKKMQGANNSFEFIRQEKKKK